MRRAYRFVIFFSTVHELNLIIRKHQTNQNGGTFEKIIDQDTPKASGLWKTRKDGELSQIFKTRDITTKCNLGIQDCTLEQKKHNSGKTGEIQITLV